MTETNDLTEQLQHTVQQAHADKTPLRIVGGDSKAFYGNNPEATSRHAVLSTRDHSGIVEYEPSELYITVRAGTKLKDIEAVLAEQQQMLPFEPPHFGEDATIGRTIACGFSGPRRPFFGAARDAILGCRIINGKGEVMSFGGKVMKNVAGYDVTRLMTGAMGTLGVLLEVTLKVLPRPEVEVSLAHVLSVQEALDVMNARAAKPLPLSAASYDGEAVILRLSGTETGVNAARKKIAGDELHSGDEYWNGLKEQTHYFFQNSFTVNSSGQPGVSRPLWRLSLAPGTLPLGLPGQWLFDWGGALRWLVSDASVKDVRDAVSAEGGHATLFRGRALYEDDTLDVFQPLTKPLFAIHKQLKMAFDPHAILNPGRFHADIDR